MSMPSKTECKRVALEAVIRMAKADSGHTLHAAAMLMQYAEPTDYNVYLPPIPPPPAMDNEQEDEL